MLAKNPINMSKKIIEYPVGTVLRLHGNLVIVTKNTSVENVRKKASDKREWLPYTNWIPIKGRNVYGGTMNESYTTKETCDCQLYMNEDSYIHQEDDHGNCVLCKGTHEIEVVHKGIDTAEYVAEDVKSFIMNAITKNFNF